MEEDFKLKNIYDKYRENKNSHVYLVETNSISSALEDIKKLIIYINSNVENDVSQLVLSGTLPTLSIISPKNQEIVTEDVEKLIVMLQKIPVITKENYFIISEAEKLNKKSGNQLLKIIEEPESDMIGFFICHSIDSVMPTISSRSQIISVVYNVAENYDEDVLKNAEEYLDKVHNKESIIINKYYIDKYKDTKDMESFINAVIYLEKKYINTLTNFDIIKKENILLSKLYELLTKIVINCNINLLLDKFIIEVSRL